MEREKLASLSALRVIYQLFISLNLLYHIYRFEATRIKVIVSTCILEENVYNIFGNNSIQKWTPHCKESLPITLHLCFLELFAF